MIKKLLCIATLSILSMPVAFAGGLLHNTNQHIDFVRMMARGASFDIDGVYTNPAGSVFNEHQGWTLSLNIQSAYQERDVNATFSLYMNPTHTKLYEGNASAPIIPSLYGVYHKDKLAVSGFLGVVGGGGKCSFDDGLPMFDAAVMAGVYGQTAALLNQYPALGAVFSGPVTPDQYDISTAMKGRQFIYGAQLGAAYRFLPWLSGYAGFRMDYFTGNYSGHVIATAGPELTGKVTQLAMAYPEMAQLLGSFAGPGGLASIKLDCDQTGWGITPIVGVDLKFGDLTLAAKYEFPTELNIENDTKQLEVSPAAFEGALNSFKDGVNTPNDLPSVFYFAAGYEFIPKKLRGTLEYHYYDDKHAEMAGDKQKALRHGTHEVLAGVEWDINERFTVSCGAQNTDYGLSDEYQSHTSFSCDSYSIGFGGAVNINENMKLNVGYFWTTYHDYTKDVPAGNPGYCGTTMAGKDVYSRSNKVFGVGLDYKF